MNNQRQTERTQHEELKKQGTKESKTNRRTERTKDRHAGKRDARNKKKDNTTYRENQKKELANNKQMKPRK